MFPPVADVILKVFPSVAKMGLVLLGIVDFNDGVDDVLFLAFGCLTEDLFGGYLDGCGCPVFYSGLVGHVVDVRVLKLWCSYV